MVASRSRRSAPGRVSATPDKPPARERYDVAVVGAGLLGATSAALLRRWAPELALVLIEADGIPNEGGATVASPGLLPPDRRSEGAAGPQLAWVQELAASVVPELLGMRAGWLTLASESTPAMPQARPLSSVAGLGQARAVTSLLGISEAHPAVLAPGGYLNPDVLALALARRAVAEGADLLLNTRARPGGAPVAEGSQLHLERLALDRRMVLGVRARQALEARAVVVASGAGGGELAEAALDRPVRLSHAFRQFPRVRLRPVRGSRETWPVVEVAGWRLRPAAGGALLVPPPAAPDPAGYRPVGGHLLGVPVGLRRELIERLLDVPELESLVASGALELGKSVRSVRGAWVSVPVGNEPVAEALGRGWWLLAGSEAGLVRDLAAAARVAAELARDLAGVEVPWPP